MTDSPDDPPVETSFQKALRLKKAGLAARQAPPGRKGYQREANAKTPPKSKPWMTR